MSTHSHSFIPYLEGKSGRVAARQAELPGCELLRGCAALTVLIQLVMISCPNLPIESGIFVQLGFVVTGFLMTGFLLRDRGRPSILDGGDRGDRWSGPAILRAIPFGWLVAVVGGILAYPHLKTLGSMPEIDPDVLYRQTGRLITGIIWEFQKPGFDGRGLIIWPLVALLAPRRSIGLVLLIVLGSDLAIQFAGMISGSTTPAAILAAPSAVFCHRETADGHGRLGRWSVFIGLGLAAALLVLRQQSMLPKWGSIALFLAPDGLGLVNFALMIVTLTVVASLSWRDWTVLLPNSEPIPIR